MMIPTPNSWFVFLVALLPAEMLGLLWHELGHVVAGNFVGMNVVSWGIGVRKAWVKLRHGRTVFYVGWPISLGLTIALQERIERDLAAEFRFILGGPLASLVGLVAGLAVWSVGLRSDLLLAWICASALLVLTSAVPMTIRKGDVRLDNDARKLISNWKRRAHEGTTALGPTLASLQALSDLMATLGQGAAARFYQIALALIEIDLHDVKGAQSRLSLLESDAGDNDKVAKLVAVAQALIAVQENSDQAEALLEAASERCQNEPTLLLTLDCVFAQWRLERGIDIGDALNQLRDRALTAGRQDWLCLVDVALFLASAGEDPEAACRALFESYARNLAGVTKARLLAITTEKLAAVGARDRARAVFEEARVAITNEAATIANETTRDSFVLNAAAPLQRAVVAAGEGMPLFIAADLAQAQTSAAKSARQDMFGRYRPAVPPVSKGYAFGRVTLGLGITNAAIFSVCVLSQILRGRPATERVWLVVLPIIGIGFLITMFTTCVSLLRSERRYRLVAIGALLATFAVFAGIFVGAPRPNDKRQSNLEQTPPSLEFDRVVFENPPRRRSLAFDFGLGQAGLQFPKPFVGDLGAGHVKMRQLFHAR